MPAGTTYTPIATTTLSSAAASYTFSSIPSTYTDLVIVGSIRVSKPSDVSAGTLLRFNGDSGSNYSTTLLTGSGTSPAATSRNTSNTYIVYADVAALNTTSEYTAVIWNFMNYSNNTTYKTVLGRSNPPDSTRALVGLWRSTSAINSITIYGSSYDIAAGTTLTLYGITAA